jgi:hypothetical protein
MTPVRKALHRPVAATTQAAATLCLQQRQVMSIWVNKLIHAGYLA